LMQNKSEATFHLKILMNRMRTHLSEYKVIRLWSDQGGEFLSIKLEIDWNDHGVELKTTNSYSPQEDATVERANGVVLPRIRAMVMTTCLPRIMCGEERRCCVSGDTEQPSVEAAGDDIAASTTISQRASA
jgi:hypothetical protein